MIFFASSTQLVIQLRNSDLQPGIQKKYNSAPTKGDRSITITQATLIAAGFTNASANLSLFVHIAPPSPNAPKFLPG